ncbi:MAG TPA: YbaB/EbfC family nucleoid-associated protein [Halanaerobiales bacterium]|nr:YbaB/EbfC family nucleoid-associated protein [Halanaerobiales bacterium]
MENMDINDIIGQVNYIKKRLAELQEELKKTTVEGSEQRKIVKVQLSGTGIILGYKIDQKEDFEINTLSSALVEATNEGLEKARKLESQKKKEIAADLNLPDNIPGLF